MIEVLLCGHCGGPLPRPDAGVRFVTCRFCEATSDLHTGERQPAASESYLAPRMKFATELAAFERVLAERVAAGEAPLPAFRGAAASELSAIADADALTNVVFGIAADFGREKGVDVTSDAQAMNRIATAYLDSLHELSTKAVSSIHLPFLTATAQGPLHFMQEVTMARLRELAATPATTTGRPKLPAPPSPAAPALPDAPPANKPWWKKLLG